MTEVLQSTRELDPPLYMFDNSLQKKMLQSRKDALVLKFINDDLIIPNLFKNYTAFSLQFMYGACLSGAPIHFHMDAWNMLIRGQKRWFVALPVSY